MENVNYKTKSEIIYLGLKQGIACGLYRPGQRIIISNIAKEFGASEIPVREAIKRLTSEGLLQSTPYVGSVVTEIRIEDMEKIYPVRIVLEGLAARMSVQHLKEHDFEVLDKIVMDIEVFFMEKRYEDTGRLNREFHETICSASHNPYLQKAIIDISALCYRNAAVLIIRPDPIPRINAEHKEILKALKKRDGALAERLVVKHKEYALENLRIYLNSKESNV